MRRLWTIGSVLLALAGTGPSPQALDLHPGIIGRDDRVSISDEGYPWDAVGQVNLGGYRTFGQCSGTLVAPSVVVTAAHCVMDPWRMRPMPLNDIHFLAGVNRSRNKGHGTARCLVFLPGYTFIPPPDIHPTLPSQAVPSDALKKDFAAIILHERLDVQPALIAESLVAEPGLPLVHAAYPADHRFVLTGHFGCALLRADLDKPLWFIDCDTHAASSGGPIFTVTDGRLQLAALLVASSERLYNIALPASVWRETAHAATCP